MRLTQDEAKNAGYVCVNGEWFAPNHWRARAIANARSAGPVAVLERNPGDGTLAEVSGKKEVGRRFLVRLTAFRTRLLDEDNLAEKYLVDLCRYAGMLPGDSPATTKIEVCQQKAEPGTEEFTRIEIFRIE